MQCLNCQFDNPPAMKFCGQCGAQLAQLCPRCGTENQATFKFCGQCGAALTTPQLPAADTAGALEQMSRPPEGKRQDYTPPHLAEKILKSRSALEGERRQVTVLFVDMAGFTALAEPLDPEEVHQIIDRCFELITAAVHRFEGTINQYTGDGVMALFGAPVAHEDSPRRAVHAALGIQHALHSLSEAETTAMASRVLSAAQFPPELRTVLMEKAEGVPLFIEEVTKTLLDLGVLERANGNYRLVKSLAKVRVPDTIQGIIMARLDRLGEDGKRTVQLASVIGRQFLVRLLERIAGLSGQLEGLLQELKTLEIVYELGLPPRAGLYLQARRHPGCGLSQPPDAAT